MRVGWLADPSEYTGGAELTQAEFRAAVPEGIEAIDCPPGEIAECDRYVLHNCVSYSMEDIRATGGRPLFKYVHDLWSHGDQEVRHYLLASANLIFCSPLQAERFGGTTQAIPPPVELARFRPTRQQRRNSKRKGAVCVGAFMNAGKGGHLVSEWADENEPVDVYGFGPYVPAGPNIRNHGQIEQRLLPAVLAQFEKFVFLPTAIEPFGRCVVEAWAAGCEIVTNQLVGARYWIEREPEKLESATDEFWRAVCHQ